MDRRKAAVQLAKTLTANVLGTASGSGQQGNINTTGTGTGNLGNNNANANANNMQTFHQVLVNLNMQDNYNEMEYDPTKTNEYILNMAINKIKERILAGTLLDPYVTTNDKQTIKHKLAKSVITTTSIDILRIGVKILEWLELHTPATLLAVTPDEFADWVLQYLNERKTTIAKLAWAQYCSMDDGSEVTAEKRTRQNANIW